MKRTPLKRGDNPIHQTGRPGLRNQPLRRTSARRRAQQAQRVARLKATLHGPQRCQFPGGCVNEATDAHETVTRARGGDPLDPDWLLCRVHHDWVGQHPAYARAMGLYG